MPPARIQHVHHGRRLRPALRGGPHRLRQREAISQRVHDAARGDGSSLHETGALRRAFPAGTLRDLRLQNRRMHRLPRQRVRVRTAPRTRPLRRDRLPGSFLPKGRGKERHTEAPHLTLHGLTPLSPPPLLSKGMKQQLYQYIEENEVVDEQEKVEPVLPHLFAELPTLQTSRGEQPRVPIHRVSPKKQESDEENETQRRQQEESDPKDPGNDQIGKRDLRGSRLAKRGGIGPNPEPRITLHVMDALRDVMGTIRKVGEEDEDRNRDNIIMLHGQIAEHRDDAPLQRREDLGIGGETDQLLQILVMDRDEGRGSSHQQETPEVDEQGKNERRRGEDQGDGEEPPRAHPVPRQRPIRVHHAINVLVVDIVPDERREIPGEQTDDGEYDDAH